MEEQRTVEAWCWDSGDGFFAHLIQTCRRNDWPGFVSDRTWWDNWVVQFKRYGVQPVDAMQAAGEVAAMSGVFLNDILAKLLERIAHINASRSRNDPVAGTYLRASAESVGCPECGGDGWATRTFRKPSHTDVPLNGALLCRCPSGRSIRRSIDAQKGTGKDGCDLAYTVDDLQCHPRLWNSSSHLFSQQPLPSPIGRDDAYWET